MFFDFKGSVVEIKIFHALAHFLNGPKVGTGQFKARSFIHVSNGSSRAEALKLILSPRWLEHFGSCHPHRRFRWNVLAPGFGWAQP